MIIAGPAKIATVSGKKSAWPDFDGLHLPGRRDILS